MQYICPSLHFRIYLFIIRNLIKITGSIFFSPSKLNTHADRAIESERERLDLNLTQEESDIANGLLQYRRCVSL